MLLIGVLVCWQVYFEKICLILFLLYSGTTGATDGCLYFFCVFLYDLTV